VSSTGYRISVRRSDRPLSWQTTASGATESYNCYKIIAKDMNLPGPWQEPGKEEPESLFQQFNWLMKKWEDEGKANPK